MFWLFFTTYVLTAFVTWSFQLREATIHREQSERVVRKYLRENHISTEVGNAVMRFFRLNFEKIAVNTHESQIEHFNDLPVKIRIELHKQIYTPILKAHAAFRSLFPPSPTLALCHLAMGEQHHISSTTVFALDTE